jgi:hypothetical protein
MFFLRSAEGRLEGLPLCLDAEHRDALRLVDQAPDGVPGGEEVVLPRHGEGSQQEIGSARCWTTIAASIQRPMRTPG